jgi:mRNA-degrading endonuclease RelE of RelBE toxin-antitoxin system
MVNVTYTHEFKKTIKKIKDNALKSRVIKQLRRIVENPEIGKPLSYALRGERTTYVKPFRIIYSYTKGEIIFHRIKHRKNVYKHGG